MTEQKPTVKPGDRVRVVLEGEVSYVSANVSGRFDVGHAGVNRNWISPEAEHVKSVEILTPPVKVGDVITDKDAADALPGNTIIRTRSGWAARKAVLSRDCWHFEVLRGFPRETTLPLCDLPVTVLYLPDAK